jgi:hypothetical protein
MKRIVSRFRPPKGMSFGKVKQLRPADVYRSRTGRKPPEELLVELGDVDKGVEGVPHKIPVRFYEERSAGDAGGKRLVLHSMTMQDFKWGWGECGRKDEQLGDEAQQLFSLHKGYPHAVVALAAHLNRQGVKELWIPVPENFRSILPSTAKGIYLGTARKLGLHTQVEEGRTGRIGPNRYFVFNTGEVGHLTKHLKPAKE